MLVVGNIWSPEPPLELAQLSTTFGIGDLLEPPVTDFSLLQGCLDVCQVGLVHDKVTVPSDAANKVIESSLVRFPSCLK